MSHLQLFISLSGDQRGERLDRALAQRLKLHADFAQAPSVKQVKRWIVQGWITHSQADRDGEGELHKNERPDRLRPSLRVHGHERLRLSVPLDQVSWLLSKSVEESLNNSRFGSAQAMQGHSIRSQVDKASSPRQLYWTRVHGAAEQLEKGADLIYADEALIALIKPARIPTAPTVDPIRESLYHQAIKTLLSLESPVLTQHQSISSSGSSQTSPCRYPYLRVSHRLDRDTSGVVVMSRSAHVNRPLGDMFKSRQIHKRYWLVCQRPHQGDLYEYLRQAQSLRDVPIFNDLKCLTQWMYAQSQYIKLQDQPFKVMTSIGKLSTPQGQCTRWGIPGEQQDVRVTQLRDAETWLYLLALTPNFALVEAQPLTGRTHQIRVHLSSLGAPLLGDHLYDGMSADRIALHARHLRLAHPITQQKLSFYAPLPADFMSPGCTTYQ